MDQHRGQQQGGDGQSLHDGTKSVMTRSRLRLVGSVTHAISAWSLVEAGRYVTEASSPTTSPRGKPTPAPLVSAHSPLDALRPSECSMSRCSAFGPPVTVP